VPELPEVETIRRQLAPRLTGRTIERARILDALWCDPAPPRGIERALRGARVEEVDRRGKYLIVGLSLGRAGGGRVSGRSPRLLMHLRMTGNLLWDPAAAGAERPHTRALMELDDGSSLAFVDVRRFGTGQLFADGAELDAYLDERLGSEPLDPGFSAELLAREAAGRSAPIKAFLLDQRRVAGVGNIYADEALFRARIHPLRPAGRLRRPDMERLRDAIVATLELGIRNQGASIDDYRHYNGDSGGMQDEFLVHLREGLPCPNCGRSIVKLRAAGRGTYICTRCQPAPRGRKKVAA
jgi:formamidopyrimidine-DNA glycosylase